MKNKKRKLKDYKLEIDSVQNILRRIFNIEKSLERTLEDHENLRMYIAEELKYTGKEND